MRKPDEQQPRIFHFLFPDPPAVPTDGLARTTRPLRIGTRGPLRIALLMVVTLAIIVVAIPAALAAVVSTQPILGALAITAVAIASMFLARGFLLGTYVTDDSLIIRRMFATSVIPWNDITITAQDPVISVRDSHDGEYSTHIGSQRIDYLWRPHALAAASDQLLNWSERR